MGTIKHPLGSFSGDPIAKVSRNRIQNAIAAGLVLVNDKRNK